MTLCVCVLVCVRVSVRESGVLSGWLQNRAEGAGEWVGGIQGKKDLAAQEHARDHRQCRYVLLNPALTHSLFSGTDCFPQRAR